MKVLFVEDIYPQISESYITTEIEYFLSRGVQVEVWAKYQGPSPYPEQVRVHRATFDEAFFSFWPDVVHSHFAKYLDIESIVNILNRVNTPATLRGHSVDYSKDYFSKLLELPHVRRMYLFPHFAADFPGHPKVITVPGCYRKRIHYLEEKDRKTVLRAGAGLSYKGIEDFFKTAALTPDFKFICVISQSKLMPNYSAELDRLNESLGLPVDLRVNLDHEETAAISRKAGIFLHTYDPKGHPFGMPVSVVEAIGSGSYILLREDSNARLAFEDIADFYRSPEDASGLIRNTLLWSPEEWAARQKEILKTAEGLSTDVVLDRIYQDWASFKK